LVEHVLELGRAIGGVDVDEDRADGCGRVLGDDPLIAIRRPDADAVARLHSACHQAASGSFAFLDELAIREAAVLVRDHERVAVSEARRGAAQVVKDGFAQKRSVAGSVHVAELGHSGPL